MKKIVLAFTALLLLQFSAHAWGFFGHQHINRLAVFTLPPEMLGFYKHYIVYLSEHAVNPDKRRYMVKNEAPRHYIDIDAYGDSALYKLPRSWKDALMQYSEDSLMSHGIVPWHINAMRYRLTEAFKARDVQAILRLSADIGHYIGDAHVPLHTTRNYNGQLTNQHGIHGLWESRLPELFADRYDLFVGKASYLPHPQLSAWQAVTSAHLALDSVLSFEKKLSGSFAEDKKYSFEQRGNATVKVYSKAYAKAYAKMLSGQVERQMRASIKMVGDFWYTCWVDAGQPDLDKLLLSKTVVEEEPIIEEPLLVPARPHDAFIHNAGHPHDELRLHPCLPLTTSKKHYHP